MSERRREFAPHASLNVSVNRKVIAEIALDSGVSAVRAHVDEVRQRLHAGRTFVEVCALSTKGIGSDNCLRAKQIFANRAGEFNKVQCGHDRVGSRGTIEIVDRTQRKVQV